MKPTKKEMLTYGVGQREYFKGVIRDSNPLLNFDVTFSIAFA